MFSSHICVDISHHGFLKFSLWGMVPALIEECITVHDTTRSSKEAFP